MKAKVYLLILDWITEHDGDDIRVEVFPTKKEARAKLREEYKEYKKDYLEWYGKECVESTFSPDCACLQLEDRYYEKHDRWFIEEKEIELTKENIIEL